MASELSGISFVTTDPAPMTQPDPMVTPGMTDTLEPIQQLSPMVMGLAFSMPLFLSGYGKGWLAV